VQIENFGIHLSADGTVVYGMKIEAVLDRVRDNVSLDHLARLLVDVHQDSSRITDSIVSAYQLGLLDLVFIGDRGNRDKINILTAEEITPKLPAEKYMDRGENENELKQVLGETRFAYDISEEDVIIFGNHGILLCGPNSKKHESTLFSYLSLTGKDIFIQNYFSRVFITLDSLKTIRRKILESAKDPNSLESVRAQLAQESRDIIMLEETLAYAAESLDTMKIPSIPPDPAGKKLFEVLDIARVRHELQRRITDLQKNTKSSHHELTILRQMSEGMKEDRMFHLQELLNENTKQISNVVQANAEQSVCLGAVQVILGGTLAFSILDRFTGTWSVVNREWAMSIIDPLLGTPFIWLAFNLAMWLAIGVFVNSQVRKKGLQQALIMDVKLHLNEECNIEMMDLYLAEKQLISENVRYSSTGVIQVITWIEGSGQKSSWGGTCPRITICYDDEHGYLLDVIVHYSKAEGKLKPKEVRECIMSDLTDHRVLAEREDEEFDEEDDE